MLSGRSEREGGIDLQYVCVSLQFLNTCRDDMRRPAAAHNNRVLSFTIDFSRDGTVGNLHVI